MSAFAVSHGERSEGWLILPANDGHSVRRVKYATEVNHVKNKPGKISQNRYSQECRQEVLALAEKLGGVKAATKPLRSLD